MRVRCEIILSGFIPTASRRLLEVSFRLKASLTCDLCIVFGAKWSGASTFYVELNSSPIKVCSVFLVSKSSLSFFLNINYLLRSSKIALLLCRPSRESSLTKRALFGISLKFMVTFFLPGWTFGGFFCGYRALNLANR